MNRNSKTAQINGK